VTAVNDLLRFGLELAGIVSLGLWGWRAGGSSPLRFVLAIAAPLVLIAIWSIWIAPKADSPLDPTVRVIVGSALLLAAAGGLWLVGLSRVAAIFAVLIIVNTILMFVLPT
jgi:hypothetical protein